MSWSKLLKKALIPGYSTVDLVKKVKNHGVVGAVKEEIKETPIMNTVYKLGKDDGKLEGMKEGYVRASREYESKLLEQAEKFKTQKIMLESDIKERDLLLKEYEEYIEQREAELDGLTKEELQMLYRMKREYEILNQQARNI